MTLQELYQHLGSHLKGLKKSTPEQVEVHELSLAQVLKDYPDLSIDRLKAAAIEVGLSPVDSVEDAKKLPQGQMATYVILKESNQVDEAAKKVKTDMVAGAPQIDKKKAIKEFAKPDMDQASFIIGRHRGLGMDIWEVTMRLPVSVDFLKAKDQDLKIGDFASFHSSDPIEILAMMANEELAARTGIEFGRPSISTADLAKQRAKGGMKTAVMSWEVGDALMAYALGLDLTKYIGVSDVLGKSEIEKRMKDAEETAEEAKKLRQDIKAGKRPESDWPEFAKAAQAKGMNYQILKRLKLEEGVKGLPLGKRFPKSKKRLSSDDEQKLSLLYKQRDAMGVKHGSPEYVKLQSQIDKMLGEVTTTANVASYPVPIGMVKPADRKKKVKESSEVSTIHISESCYAVVPKLAESVSEGVLHSYLETALWSSTDNKNEYGGDPMDKNYDISDIDQDTVEKAKKDLAAFWEKCEEKHPGILDQYDDERVAHDFWLTRNRHGAGFWDGDYEKTPGDGDKLTQIAKTFGEVDLYVGDDGKIYGA